MMSAEPFKTRTLKEEENYCWEMVDYLGWKEDGDYDRIRDLMVNTFSENDIMLLDKFVRTKQIMLMNFFEWDWLNDPGIPLSDDSWSDLTAEVVGRGKKFYNKITVKKLTKMAVEGDYRESFLYCFQV